jgi:chromosome segregation ATPase
MAKSLADKLNTLIRSGVQGVAPRARRRDQAPGGKHIDRKIAALRQQIDRALDDEDRKTAEISAAQGKIAEWDQQADRALAKGDEAGARHAVRQMQLEQRRLAMLEADLAQHRYSTSDLISRVNELEAVVAAARHQPQPTAGQTDDAEDEALSARLRRVREDAAGPPASVPPEVDDQAVEDDLARRRARLSQ